MVFEHVQVVDSRVPVDEGLPGIVGQAAIDDDEREKYSRRYFESLFHGFTGLRL